MLASAHALEELVHLGEASGRFVLVRKLFFFANTAQVVEAWSLSVPRVVNFCSAKSIFGSSKTPSDSAKKPSDSANLNFG